MLAVRQSLRANEDDVMARCDALHVALPIPATLPTGFAGPFAAAFASDLDGLSGLIGMSAGRLALVVVFAFLLSVPSADLRPAHRRFPFRG